MSTYNTLVSKFMNEVHKPLLGYDKSTLLLTAFSELQFTLQFTLQSFSEIFRLYVITPFEFGDLPRRKCQN